MGRNNSFNNTGWGLAGWGAALQKRTWETWGLVRKILKHCSKLCSEHHQDVWGWSICPAKKHWEFELVQPEAEIASGIPNRSPQCVQGGHWGDGAGLFIVLQDRSMRDNGQIQMRARRSNFFPMRDSQAVAYADQRGFSVFIPGGFQGQTGWSPQQPGLTWGDPAVSRGLDQRPSQVSPGLNYSLIFWQEAGRTVNLQKYFWTNYRCRQIFIFKK